MDSVRPRFDGNQGFQLEAVSAVVEVMAGAEADDPSRVSSALENRAVLDAFNEQVYGNAFLLSSSSLRENLLRVQDDRAVPLDMRKKTAPDERPDDFAVEMETGTGKTYVYLRTIAELHEKYGFSKFVIVVPRPAILETVMWNLDALKEHLRTQYGGLQFDFMRYESKRVAQVRNYATTPSLQILVMNIDAFNSKTNIINRPHEDTGGYAPIEFLRACRPIVILDEPQSLDGPTHIPAISSLEPLIRLRYSATHKREPKTGRYLQHLVYRLTPVDAYDLKLVKHINVLSITQDQDLNDPYVEIRKITPSATDVTATAIVHKSGALGTAATQVTLKKDMDLREVTGREIYEGWIVEHIHADQGVVEFGNGQRIAVTRSNAETATDQLQRLMIRQAIEAHMEKEADLDFRTMAGTLPAPLKPLTLFFVDKVDNYYPPDGKFRLWFEEEYERLRRDGRYSHIPMPDVSEVHDGYFGVDNKGVPTKTQREDTEGAKRAYEKIMKDKGALLSPDEPLRFIFSHSALAEGWDNPNVFVICNFQTGKSDIRKRQQIGRGLRLPVMANGERCFDEGVNQLTVIANESFTEFADALQKEIEEDTGEKFEKRITDVREKKPIALKRQVLESAEFAALWQRISAKTTYKVDYDTDTVVANALTRINRMPKIEPVRFRIAKAGIAMSRTGLEGVNATSEETEELEGARRIPDVVGELTRRVPLSRATIVRILKECDRLADVKINPSVFVDQVVEAMNDALYQEVAKGIVYTPTGERWEASLFESRHQKESISPRVLDVTKTITDRIAVDSGVEETFAEFLEKRDDVKFYLKLPGWYQIETPLGHYNPDWAIVREVDGSDRLYLVRETKGTADEAKLQWEHEAFKIRFGRAHYSALEVDYTFGKDPEQLILPTDVWPPPDPSEFEG